MRRPGSAFCFGNGAKDGTDGMRELAIFWGCTIPARFPSIEKATRLLLQDLQVRPHELAGHTCCPEATLVKTRDASAFYITAARNLAIAGRAGLDLMTPCSGCYSTFKETQSHVSGSPSACAAIDSHLASENLTWPPALRVRHLAEWLADVDGAEAVAARAVKSFAGMRLAVHYGCHLLRPQPAVNWDDRLKPSKVETLVEAFGAQVVDHPTKMLCCGGALDRCGERDASLALARRKLRDLAAHEVDALVVVCPSCFQQFDLNQAVLRRGGDDVAVPVLYLSELVALAYGHDAGEIGLDTHRVSAEPFLAKWNGRLTGRARAGELFDLALLEKYGACGACRDDCPVGQIDPSFQPHELVAQILDGDLDAVLDERRAWKCLECYTCLELCPSRVGLADTMRVLKGQGAARDQQPEAVRQAFHLFCDQGVLGKARDSVRDKLVLRRRPRPLSGCRRFPRPGEPPCGRCWRPTRQPTRRDHDLRHVARQHGGAAAGRRSAAILRRRRRAPQIP
jgi:heterodisulfide reductase subunit B